MASQIFFEILTNGYYYPNFLTIQIAQLYPKYLC